MEIFKLICCITASTFIGFNILYLAAGRSLRLYLPEALAVSFGLGLGSVSLEMLLFFLLRYDFNIPWLLAPWAAVFAVNIVMFIRGKSLPIAGIPPGALKPYGALDIFLAAGISFEVIYAFFRALIKPIESYDAVAIYAIKSKIFYLARSIPHDYFSGLATLFPHPDYPLNIPLAETFLYIGMGDLNDQLVKVIFPLFFAGILCMLYCAVRRFASRTYALLFTFLLASIPQFNAYATNAYLELPLAFYYCASALLLFRWFENKEEVSFLIVSSVMVALAGWTKNEGLMYCLINIILLSIFLISGSKAALKEKMLYLCGYSGIALGLSLPWLAVKRAFQFVNSDIGIISMNPFYLYKQSYKIWLILYDFQKHVIGPKKWNIIWAAFILVLILYHKDMLKGTRKYLTISLALAVSGYIFAYLFSVINFQLLVSTTLSRFLLHFLPLAVLLMAMALREDAGL